MLPATLTGAMRIEWREGDVIRRLRMEAGWKLKHLTAATGLDQKTIHQIEMGHTKEAKRSTLRKIASAFGLTERQLLDAVPMPMELPIVFAPSDVTGFVQKLERGGAKDQQLAGAIRTVAEHARGGHRQRRTSGK